MLRIDVDMRGGEVAYSAAVYGKREQSDCNPGTSLETRARMVTPTTRSLRLIVSCLAMATIADVADRKSAGMRHVIELGCGLLALFCPGAGTLLVLSVACLAITLHEPFERWLVHHYIATALHAAVLSSAVVVALVHRRRPEPRELLELIRTPFRWIALAVFFAGLAKLNRDFLDPRISCAGVYYLWTRQWPGLDFLPATDGAKQIVIALVVGAELLGPVLLIAQRTRPLGLALLWLLTLGLCANTHAIYVEFIGLFWIGSLLWLPPRVLEGAAERLAALSSRLGAPLGVEPKLAGALALALAIEHGRGQHDHSPWIYAWLSAGLAMVVTVTAAVLLAAHASPAQHESPKTPVLRSRLRFVVLLVPLAVLSNEARLYLGWPESRPALRMAANLIANDHETNHLLLSRLPRLAWGGPWGLMIERPYRMKREPVLCGKPEPGSSRRDTMLHMRERLAQDRLASGG